MSNLETLRNDSNYLGVLVGLAVRLDGINFQALRAIGKLVEIDLMGIPGAFSGLLKERVALVELLSQ